MRAAIAGACAFALSYLASPASAQVPVPDETTQARLVWSTMIAVDNANRTGNYSVLHSLASTELQTSVTPDGMADVLAELRERRVDVGRALLIAPEYAMPPSITPEGQLRLRGGFEFRPSPLRFDLLYVLEGGGWRLDGISIAEMDGSTPLR